MSVPDIGREAGARDDLLSLQHQDPAQPSLYVGDQPRGDLADPALEVGAVEGGDLGDIGHRVLREAGHGRLHDHDRPA